MNTVAGQRHQQVAWKQQFAFYVAVGIAGLIFARSMHIMIQRHTAPQSGLKPRDSHTEQLIVSSTHPDYEGRERIVYIPDLHGDLQQALAVLSMMHLIDQSHHWIGGKAILVQGGDVVDRGPNSLDLLKLFKRLKGEAEAAGGQVITLLGNHELMLLQGDYRYFNRLELAALLTSHNLTASSPAAVLEMLNQVFSPAGWAGQLIRQRLLAALLRTTAGNDVAAGCNLLAIHAAALPWMLDLPILGTTTMNSSSNMQRDTASAAIIASDRSSGPQHEATSTDTGRVIVDMWNEVVHTELAGCTGRQCGTGKLLHGDGAVWSRFYAMHPEKQVCKAVKTVADHLGVSRILVGHTIQESGTASVKCGGRLVMMDIGMSQAYGGKLGHGIALQCLSKHTKDVNQTMIDDGSPKVTLWYGNGIIKKPRITMLPPIRQQKTELL